MARGSCATSTMAIRILKFNSLGRRHWCNAPDSGERPPLESLNWLQSGTSGRRRSGGWLRATFKERIAHDRRPGGSVTGSQFPSAGCSALLICFM